MNLHVFMDDSGLLCLHPVARESITLGFSWDSVGRRSSCLLYPYQGSDPDLRPSVAAGARRKLGQRLSRFLFPPTSTRVCMGVLDYLHAPAKFWISCVRTCAHLFWQGRRVAWEGLFLCVCVCVCVCV